MRNMKVTLQFWHGDMRPSQQRYTMGADGGPVPVPNYGRFSSSYEWRTTEHGARTIVGRERNAETRRHDHVAMETKTREDGVTLHYIVSRWEGVYTTAILWSEKI